MKTISVQTLGRMQVGGKPTRQARPLELLVLLMRCQRQAHKSLLEASLFETEVSGSALRNLVQRARLLGLPIACNPHSLFLTAEVHLDLLELEQALAAGAVWQALHLYHGAFLPGATSPFAEGLRTHLEEQMIQLALHLQDPQVLLQVTLRVGLDLRLTEALQQHRTPGLCEMLLQASDHPPPPAQEVSTRLPPV